MLGIPLLRSQKRVECKCTLTNIFWITVRTQSSNLMRTNVLTGWVPGSCGGDGNLGASTFSVSNLKIQGSVIHGPEPRRCSGELAEELSNAPLRPAHLPAPAVSEVVV